jgi:transposase
VLDRLKRHDLTDEEWERLGCSCPLIAAGRPVGRSPDGDQRDLLPGPGGLPVAQFRAVATRYDKRERIYLGTIDVASISIWLRDPVP